MKPAGRLSLSELHWPLIGVTVLIALMGIYNLHSAAAARDPHLYLTQAMWMGIAALGVALFLFLDYRITEGLAYPVFTIVVLLLMAVLMQGRVAKGAARWLQLGPVGFQPSELAKLATVFCLSRYFSTRMIPGGYSIGSLVKPLNPSRPLAVIIALAVFWNHAWLADPLGQLARFLRKGLGDQLPPPSDLLWFRILALLGVAATTALLVALIYRGERRSALLSPWPPTRRRRLLVLTGVLAVVAVAALVLEWRSPVMRDPLGALIRHLVVGAAPGGEYAVAEPGLTLRLVLSIGAGAYLLASLSSLRQGVASPIDLLLAPVDLLLLPAALILVQPDLGTAGVVVLVGLSMLLVVGVRLRSLLILGAFAGVVATVGWAGVLKDYQKRRVLTFLDPEQDTRGAGWNAVQSMIAVGSGRWTGKGHKGGPQTQLKFLPEQHTDFAFSVWGEEQGFLGSAFLAVLYLALILFSLSIAADAREHYGGLLATGATAIILWQALINMSMVIGLFPVVGITLPLFSYGGTSVMTVLGAVGILLNVHFRRRAH
jgi:cell division protein FtsW (lipid II flippase)